MACDECQGARLSPLHHRTFNPACLYCGARYFQALKTVPPPRVFHEADGTERVETTEQRQEWRKQVLTTWSAYGHDVAEMKRLAGEGAVPYEPVTRVRPQSEEQAPATAPPPRPKARKPRAKAGA